MNRKIALVAIMLTIIVLVVATLLVQSLNNSANNSSNVNNLVIKDFSINSKWGNPGGIAMVALFNLTIQNLGINNVSGLNFSVVIIVDNTSKVENVHLPESLSNFTLLAGEVREFEGYITTDLGSLEDAGIGLGRAIGEAGDGWNYVATVKLGDEVLDEFNVSLQF